MALSFSASNVKEEFYLINYIIHREHKMKQSSAEMQLFVVVRSKSSSSRVCIKNSCANSSPVTFLRTDAVLRYTGLILTSRA